MTNLTRQGMQSCVDTLSLIPYFPGDDGSRSALLEQIQKMVTFDEQAAWLACRATQVFSTWPGMRELRALFCKRFRPRDNFEADSQIFPDGFASEAELGPVPVEGLLLSRTEREALSSATIPASRQLTSGVSADPEAEKIVLDLAPLKTLPPAAGYVFSSEDERRTENALRDLYGLPRLPDVPATAPPPMP